MASAESLQTLLLPWQQVPQKIVYSKCTRRIRIKWPHRVWLRCDWRHLVRDRCWCWSWCGRRGRGWMFFLLRLDICSWFLAGLRSRALCHFLHLLLKILNSSGKSMYLLFYCFFHFTDFPAKTNKVICGLFQSFFHSIPVKTLLSFYLYKNYPYFSCGSLF